VIYNLIGVALAMAGLLQPVFSAFAMVASSIFVTSNAMKMNKFPLLEESTQVNK
jgi:Cu+-exporting ATPase